MTDWSADLCLSDEAAYKVAPPYGDGINVATRPKSKFNSYLTTHRSTPSLDNQDIQYVSRFGPRDRDLVYRPEPERMMDTILARLLNHPAEGLPPEYNGFLLHIFESYRSMQRELETAQKQVEMESRDHRARLMEPHHLEDLRMGSASNVSHLERTARGHWNSYRELEKDSKAKTANSSSY